MQTLLSELLERYFVILGGDSDAVHIFLEVDDVGEWRLVIVLPIVFVRLVAQLHEELFEIFRRDLLLLSVETNNTWSVVKI